MPRFAAASESYEQNRGHQHFALCVVVYNPSMDNVYQLLAVYVFAATPCFAGWLANGGEREDVGLPIVGSILLTIVLLALVLFFA